MLPRRGPSPAERTSRRTPPDAARSAALDVRTPPRRIEPRVFRGAFRPSARPFRRSRQRGGREPDTTGYYPIGVNTERGQPAKRILEEDATRSDAKLTLHVSASSFRTQTKPKPVRHAPFRSPRRAELRRPPRGGARCRAKAPPARRRASRRKRRLGESRRLGARGVLLERRGELGDGGDRQVRRRARRQARDP